MSAVWGGVLTWPDPAASPVDRRRRRGALRQRVTCKGAAPPVGDRATAEAKCQALAHRYRAPAVTFLCLWPESHHRLWTNGATTPTAIGRGARGAGLVPPARSD